MINIKLKQLLQQKGKTRYWLSKQTNLDYNTINRIMNNEVISLHLLTIEKICLTLDCSISDLLEIVYES
ncbi:MAG: helix-turn-helix domain-containing protein [Christensenellales bacterium]|jgi:putative transcriptional regulator